MGGRAVEGTGLENRQRVKAFEGSNPSPSASLVTLEPPVSKASRGFLAAHFGRYRILKCENNWGVEQKR